MTRREALAEGLATLASAPPDGACVDAGLGDTASSGTAGLDASLLLAHCLGLSRTALIASLPEVLDAPVLHAYRVLLERRREGRPVAYLLGRKEFYGRDFLVDERVLVPRPDTELLVEAALDSGDLLRAEGAEEALALCDACTGSGCVALSLACERPAWRVTATDLSPEALAAAEANARTLVDPGRPGGRPRLVEADLLEPKREGSLGPFHLITANPPYVESSEAALLARAWGEPLLALDGGPDGLDPYRRLLPEAFAALVPGGWLLVEADPSQAAGLRALFTAVGFLAITTRKDLAGLDRVTLGRRPWKT